MKQGANATVDDHLRSMLTLMKRGAAVSLTNIPNDPTFLSSHIGGGTAKAIAERIEAAFEAAANPAPVSHMEGSDRAQDIADIQRLAGMVGATFIPDEPPQEQLRVDVDRLAASIVTAACELDGPADPAGDDTISITTKDLEAVVHRHVTAALEASE